MNKHRDLILIGELAFVLCKISLVLLSSAGSMINFINKQENIPSFLHLKIDITTSGGNRVCKF